MERGLVAAIDVSRHQPRPDDSFEWVIRPADRCLPLGDEYTVYLDGSFLDGPSRALGRTGWGLAVLDGEARVVASAFGVPPGWVRTIHGAEMWALFAALSRALPGMAYRSDRRAVVDTMKSGLAVAAAAHVELARLWIMVYAACDDLADPANDLNLVWMPAHTTAADIGRAVLSDGSLLSQRDRAGNEAADALAKRGAKLHRVPEPVRKRARLVDELATWAARSLGIATHVANAAVFEGTTRPCRDAQPLPRGSRSRCAVPPASSHLVVGAVPSAGKQPVESDGNSNSSGSCGQMSRQRLGDPRRRRAALRRTSARRLEGAREQARVARLLDAAAGARAAPSPGARGKIEERAASLLLAATEPVGATPIVVCSVGETTRVHAGCRPVVPAAVAGASRAPGLTADRAESAPVARTSRAFERKRRGHEEYAAPAAPAGCVDAAILRLVGARPLS